MSRLGRLLQLVGLTLTGYAVIVAFGGDMSEADMFKYGLGGFAVFFAGTLLARGRG
ncbi:MAG TPA: hypothetical protein VEI02_13940 [Planctomycetota bacterium]|nr:hypothetical protein [Planctomycetota bacterium]